MSRWLHVGVLRKHAKDSIVAWPTQINDWQRAQPPETVFHEGSGKVMNTIPPNDFSYCEMRNEVVQQEPAGSLDPELMGSIDAIGVVTGKPFAPDARMKKILTEAARNISWPPWMRTSSISTAPRLTR